MANIYSSASQLIGRTPLLALRNIEKCDGLTASLLAKLEARKGNVNAAAALLATLPPIRQFETEPIPMEMLERKKNTGFKISVIDDTYYVEAEWLLKILNKTDVEDFESLQYFQKVLDTSGIFEALRNKGIEEGDTVNIYDLEFEYVP